jgi:phosphatidylserine/phosphatidylglycerophosphate/cardiolipin synthase-like enzyme
MVIVDAQMLYVGSANWTGAGLGVKADGRRNFEVGWITRDEHVIDDAQANFQRIWDGSRCRDCQLRSSCEAPLDLGSAPRPGRRKRLVRVGRA